MPKPWLSCHLCDQVMMNARKAPSKRSRIERQMDTLILGMFALLFAMCVIGATCFTVWTRHAGNSMWYLQPENTAAAVSSQPSPWQRLMLSCLALHLAV